MNQDARPVRIAQPDLPATGGLRLRSREGPVEIIGFDTRKKLGLNGLGSSFLCQHRASGQVVVIEVVRSSEGPRERLLQVLNLALETPKGQDPYEAALKGRIVPIRERYKTVPHGLEGLLDFIALAVSLAHRFHSGVEMYRDLKAIPGPAAVGSGAAVRSNSPT